MKISKKILKRNSSQLKKTWNINKKKTTSLRTRTKSLTPKIKKVINIGEEKRITKKE